MQLVRQLPGDVLQVRRVEADAVVVGDRRMTRSFALTGERLMESWGPTDVAGIDEAACAGLLGLAPELVLLGTGARQRFPAHAVLAQFLTKGIGIEVMDNAAAARTFNVLVAEGRRVVAAFILP